MNLNHFQAKAYLHSSIVLLAVLAGILIVSGNITYQLFVFLIALFWIITYLGICSIECLGLIFTLGINLFLLRRLDFKYTLIAGGMIFKLSFFILLFVLCILFLKIFFSNAISRNNIINKNKSIPSFNKLLLLIGIGTISAFFNREDCGKALDSLYALLYFVVPIFYAYLIPKLNLNRFEPIFLAKFFVIIGLTISLLVITVSFKTALAMQILGLQSLGRRAIGWDFARIGLSFGTANAIGAILLMIFPLSVSFYLIERRVFVKSLFMSVSILVAVGTLFTLSRTSGIVFCVLILGFLLSTRAHSFRRKRYILLTIMFVTITGLVLSFDFSRYQNLGEDFFRRVENWKTSMIIAIDHMLLGTAPNNIYKRMDFMWTDIAQKKHIGWQKLLEYKSTYYKGHWTLFDPHNVYLMILAELGLFGFLVFLFILVDIIKSILNAIKKDFIGTYEKQILRGMLWGIIGFLLHCLTGSYLVNNYKVAVFFWIYAGTALVIAHDRSSSCSLHISIV